MSQPVLKVRGLKTFYRTRLKENVYSVDGVDLDLYEGRVLASLASPVAVSPLCL